jgi:hypothetical protein
MESEGGVFDAPSAVGCHFGWGRFSSVGRFGYNMGEGGRGGVPDSLKLNDCVLCVLSC